MTAEVGVAIVSRDRRESLLRTLAELTGLPERPPVCVVDNGSGDGTAAAVAAEFPAVELIVSERNLGAAGRNLAAGRLGTPLVAFSDDDSCWAPGSLASAAASFRCCPALGLLAARILVGEEQRLDPVSREMEGPPAPGLPGPRVSGFVACGAIVRREAFLGAGGFCRRFGVGGEERLLAIDLRAAGWELCYLPEVVAIHFPERSARPGRSWRTRRTDLWTSWLRDPAPLALRATVDLALSAAREREARLALRGAVAGLPWALRERRVPAARPPRQPAGSAVFDRVARTLS